MKNRELDESMICIHVDYFTRVNSPSLYTCRKHCANHVINAFEVDFSLHSKYVHKNYAHT